MFEIVILTSLFHHKEELESGVSYKNIDSTANGVDYLDPIVVLWKNLALCSWCESDKKFSPKTVYSCTQGNQKTGVEFYNELQCFG